MLTVISSSALMSMSSVGVVSDVGAQDSQYLQKIVGLLIALRKKAQ